MTLPYHNHSKPSDVTPTIFRVVLVKWDQSWRFEWDEGGEKQLLDTLTSLACDTEASFDWSDLAVMRRHIQQQFGQRPRKVGPKSDDLIRRSRSFLGINIHNP